MRTAAEQAVLERLVQRCPRLSREDAEYLFDHACLTLEQLYGAVDVDLAASLTTTVHRHMVSGNSAGCVCSRP